jgi:hypothetical protein
MAEIIGKHITQLMSSKKELIAFLEWQYNKNEHIHEEVKEQLKSGDTDEQLKNDNIHELYNTEIREFQNDENGLRLQEKVFYGQ